MITVVLPAYNEEETIVPLLAEMHRLLTERFLGLRVIVVDDGSTDRTAELVRSFQGIEIELVQHSQNIGLAEAIKTGLVHALSGVADTDVIVTMDADNTHSPGLIFRMANLADEGNGLVIASRYVPGARVIGVSRLRTLISWGGNWLLRLLFPTKGVKDFTSGYRAYRAGILKKAFEQWGDCLISQQGFSCTVDILLKLRSMNVVMNEVPLILRYDLKTSASKMNVWKYTGQMLRLVARRVLGAKDQRKWRGRS